MADTMGGKAPPAGPVLPAVGGASRLACPECGKVYWSGPARHAPVLFICECGTRCGHEPDASHAYFARYDDFRGFAHFEQNHGLATRESVQQGRATVFHAAEHGQGHQEIPVE